MNLARERVLNSFIHEIADRIPFDLGSRGSSIGLSAYDTLKAHLGLYTPDEVLDRRLAIAVIEESIPARFQVDTRYVYIKVRACRSLYHRRPIGTA